jgi:hypothetical protein
MLILKCLFKVGCKSDSLRRSWEYYRSSTRRISSPAALIGTGRNPSFSVPIADRHCNCSLNPAEESRRIGQAIR